MGIKLKSHGVIVLANQMNIDGTLMSESKLRAKKAVEIFKSMRDAYLITCGWAYRDDTDLTIADAFKDYIVNELGVDESKVMIEDHSRDTVGDAIFTKINCIIPNKSSEITVVTSDYHVARTKEIFSFIYGCGFMITVVGAKVPFIKNNYIKESESLTAFKKTFVGVKTGDDQEILSRMRAVHPFYNGVIYKEISV